MSSHENQSILTCAAVEGNQPQRNTQITRLLRFLCFVARKVSSRRDQAKLCGSYLVLQFSPATAAIPMLHGDNLTTFVPPGAVKIGPTPPTIVIAVTSPELVPSVEIRITVSPFWKPATLAGAIVPNER